jgi:sulfotransferase famil protein
VPSFINDTERYILTTGLKVMYTSLTQQPALRVIRWNVVELLRHYLNPRVTHYMLTRNPYDRLVSFYVDKLATINPAKVERRGWQDCQRLFFPFVSLSGREPFEIVRNRLQSITFAEFIEMLPMVYERDAHLHPQVRSMTMRAMAFRLPFRIDGQLAVERDLGFLRDDLHLDISIRENNTPHAGYQSYFTRSLYALANRVYHRDFARFGYQVHSE